MAADVARLRQVLARQDGPTIVVGHSYGGQIVTALGTDAPNVHALVYVAAFGLDGGESIGKLLTQGPPGPALAHEVMGVPAWKSQPSWFMVADGDQPIPPDAERQFAARMGATTVEIATNHVAMVSHPYAVVQLIEAAAEAVQAAA